MPQTSVILDLAIGAVLLLFLFIGARKGFFRMLADLVLVFAAILGARFLADWLSGAVAQRLTPHLEGWVSQRLEETMGDLAGLAEEVIASVAAMGPDRVVYISCDPGTLGRDVRRFGERGYRARRACAVDMFPGTHHVETVALLTREP